MKDYEYKIHGTCARKVKFGIDQGKLYHVKFKGGCPGNTAAVGKLLEGRSAQEAVDLLKGNRCGLKWTSCADQLARKVEEALKEDQETVLEGCQEETSN